MKMLLIINKTFHICTPRQGEQLDEGAELRGGEQAAAEQQARHRDPGGRGQAQHHHQQDPALQGEQRHVNCDMNVISSVNPQPIKALLDLATTFE